MRHQKAFGKLNRSSSHRRALLRNLATSLVLHKRIITTLPKAKALKRVADKLVTLAKVDDLHNRRLAMSYLFCVNKHGIGNTQKLTPVHELFTKIAPGFVDRNGGYTRVLHINPRQGDKAPMALIEFVEAGKVSKKSKSSQVKRRVIEEDQSGQETDSLAEGTL